MSSVGSDIVPELRKLVLNYGLRGVVYSYNIRDIDDWTNSKRTSDYFIKQSVERRQVFSSDKEILREWRSMHKHTVEKRTDILCALRSPLYHWKDNCAASVAVKCPFSDELAGYFTLFFCENLDASQINEVVGAVSGQLKQTHLQICSKHGKEINPIVDYKIISRVSALILSSLAEGLSRSQVAEQFRLTNRGIDYHVSVLKRELAAKSLANLVYCSGRLMLI